MSSIQFYNPGLIDLRAIKTFGVSAKEKVGAIGYFGTGLKYAIAVLLREGQAVTIWRGTKKYEFKAQATEVRNKEFSIVTMNDEELAFTTELGKDWEMWQAFRELYCNCLDEDGRVSEVSKAYYENMNEDSTVVVVEGDEFRRTYLDRASIIIENREPICVCPGVEIYQGGSNHVFYKGIRAGKVDRASKYTYNFNMDMSLTEDRTIKYMFEAHHILCNALMQMQDAELLEELVTTGSGYYEGTLNFDQDSIKRIAPGEVFLRLVSDLRKSPKYSVLNHSAVEMVRSCGHKYIAPVSSNLDDIQELQLKKAIHFCKEMGYDDIGERFPIIVTEELPNDILGMAEDGKIYISTRTFLMGTKMVAGTLLEEYIHLSEGLHDETRAMQNYLFDLVVTLQERIMGQPI